MRECVGLGGGEGVSICGLAFDVRSLSPACAEDDELNCPMHARWFVRPHMMAKSTAFRSQSDCHALSTS